MGVYDDLAKLESKSPALNSGKVRYKSQPSKKKPEPPDDKPVNRPIGQSTGQSTDRSMDRSIDIDTLGPVMDRPRAFYITHKVDRWLEDGIKYLREKGLYKVDRSILVNALLHDKKLYQPEYLDKLRGKLLAHLTNKSLKNVESTDQSID